MTTTTATTTTTTLERSPMRVLALAEAQVALLAIVLLFASAASFGVRPAAGMGAGALATAWASARARTRRAIVVVGDAEFCSRVGLAAAGRRRVAERYVIHDDAAVATVVPAELPSCDEIVVDGRFLAAVRRSAPHLMSGDAASVHVVDAGVVNEGIFDDPLGLANRCVKRTLDLTIAIVGLLVALPVLIAAMIAIKLDSPGSAVFRQDRVGDGGRRFRLYKLRTMYADNDDSAHRKYVADLIAGNAEQKDGMFKLVDDPRITRVGKFLRKTSLDELPQLWNVILGDMSIVGPRPPMVSEAELYDSRAWQRLMVRPGLTGLWQVNGRCELTFDEMIDLDIEYSKSWSPLLEMQILVKTPKVVLTAKGAA